MMDSDDGDTGGGRPVEEMAWCRAAHGRLLATIDGLTDETTRRSSGLPNWTVGHVLTHIARNADSHVRMLEGALRGEAAEQYAGGDDQRAADIEAGATRPAEDVCEDVRSTAQRLEDTWDRMTTAAWGGHGLALGRPWPCREMPFHRWREVEIHHVDLGLGYGFVDWPEEYVRQELPRAVATLPTRISDATARRRVLAWLVGRATAPDHLDLDDWQSDPHHYFTPGR